ncbi:MAG: DUF3726 domain-containing protein [Pseudomonadota bacterium]
MANESDPTIQSPLPPTGPGAVTVSFSEIDAMGRKAARGAGYAWGLAEEAGRAARWLSAHGLPGVVALARVLRESDGRTGAPRLEAGVWQASGGALCPIQLGAALSDYAGGLVPGMREEAGAVRVPLLLLPFLAWSAQALRVHMSLDLEGERVFVSPEGLVDRPGLAVLMEPARRLSLSLEAGSGEVRIADRSGEQVPRAVWVELGLLAARTYVPASDASRLSGAGAGTLDND